MMLTRLVLSAMLLGIASVVGRSRPDAEGQEPGEA